MESLRFARTQGSHHDRPTDCHPLRVLGQPYIQALVERDGQLAPLLIFRLHKALGQRIVKITQHRPDLVLLEADVEAAGELRAPKRRRIVR